MTQISISLFTFATFSLELTQSIVLWSPLSVYILLNQKEDLPCADLNWFLIFCLILLKVLAIDVKWAWYCLEIELARISVFEISSWSSLVLIDPLSVYCFLLYLLLTYFSENRAHLDGAGLNLQEWCNPKNKARLLYIAAIAIRQFDLHLMTFGFYV